MNKVLYAVGAAIVFVLAVLHYSANGDSPITTQFESESRHVMNSVTSSSRAALLENNSFGEITSDPKAKSRPDIDDYYVHYQRSSDRDEKLDWIAQLSLVTSSLDEGELKNSALKKLLTVAVTEEDDDVRGYAIMNYARMGEPISAVNLLKSSFLANVIDADLYYSELARRVFHSDMDANTRSSVLKEITSSSSEYTALIMFSATRSSIPSELTKEDVDRVISYLEINRPSFPAVFSELWHVDAGSYSDWLISMAVLCANKDNHETPVDYLSHRFKHGFLDPREAVSLIASGFFDRGFRGEKFLALKKLFLDEALRYANSYPDNFTVQSLRFEVNTGE